MALGDRLGLAGIVLALLGIAITILWPAKRWIGWLCLALGLGVCATWGVIELMGRGKAETEAKSSAGTSKGVPLTENPLEIVDFNSTNDISISNNSLLSIYAIRLLVNVEEPKLTRSFGLDFDIDSGKTTTHHIGDGFYNVRSLSLLADTWKEHLQIATRLYQACGIQLSFFSPIDPAFEQIKSAHSKNKRGLAYQETTGVIYYQVRGLEGTSEQTVPIIVITSVNDKTCPRYIEP